MTNVLQWWHKRGSWGFSSFDHDQHAFLPAALAIQEKPPAPLPRMIAYVILIFFIGFLVWASLSRVDIVASAEGKIIPSGRVKMIQPLDKAIVKEILVKEGQYVKAGDDLVLLDQTLTQASVESLVMELQSNEQRLLAHQHVLQGVSDGQKSGQICGERAVLQAVHEAWCRQRLAQYYADLGSLQARFQEVDAEQAVSRNVIQKIQRTLPLAEEHASALAQLQSDKIVSRVQFLQVERERIQQEEDLAVERKRQQVFETRKAELWQQQEALRSQTKGRILEQLVELEKNLESLRQELRKAENLDFYQTLVSPVDGVVQQLGVTTVGQVVTPAQEIMLIVPLAAQREVEVMLANKDVGYVYPGQKAEIKIHTFPFTRYGVINAEVLQVSEDAVNDEKLGLVFPVRLALQQKTISANGRDVALKPGMSVTAEIKTGKRRLIEFFLAPMLKSGAETARER